MKLNRRQFLQSLASVAVTPAMPPVLLSPDNGLKFLVRIREIRYYDRRLTDEELLAIRRGIFP